MTYFMYKLNWELNSLVLKFFPALDGEFYDYFASILRVKLTREKFHEYFRESASRKNFHISFLKGFCGTFVLNFSHLLPNPYFNALISKRN